MMIGLFDFDKINDDRFICFWDKVMVVLLKFYVGINDDRFIRFFGINDHSNIGSEILEGGVGYPPKRLLGV
tara:strand:- start:528 stop:740 length:213 start_codon:yes stop_codon:yes gene_type:complete